MFITLFIKECKIVSKSITYYIFLFCMLFFYLSQMQSYEKIIEPKVNAESYGNTYSNNPTVIMKMTLAELAKEYCNNKYATYPLGFYKEVILSEKRQQKIAEILKQITNTSIDDICNKVKKYERGISYDVAEDKTAVKKEKYKLDIKLREPVNYTQFLSSMKEVDDLLGGGSKYSSDRVKNNALVSMTYEEALSVYDDYINKDHVTGGYARLFCDYLGIFLGIFPVFLAFSRVHLDKKSHASEVLFSKKIASTELILSRYFATVIMILVPILILSLAPLIDSLCYANSLGIKVDVLAFAKYIIIWLMPTVLITVSVGFFITELLNSPLAILVQCMWWYITVFTASNQTINVGWNFILRFNSIGDYDIYTDMRDEILRNRIVYLLISILFILLTITIYETKRKGVLNFGGKIFKNNESELET